MFTCAHCGHKMRLAGARCGACGSDKTLLQRPLLLIGLILLASAAIGAFVVAPPVE